MCLFNTTFDNTYVYYRRINKVQGLVPYAVLSVRFEVGVSLLLAPSRADKKGPPFHLAGYARIQPVIRKRVPTGTPVGAGSY